MRCVIVDQNDYLPDRYDFFELKQRSVAIDGLRSRVGGKAFASVRLPVDGQRDGQSHP
jgi:hypothetical protein